MTLQEIQVKRYASIKGSKTQCLRNLSKYWQLPYIQTAVYFSAKMQILKFRTINIHKVIDLIVLVDSECFGCDFIVNSDKLWVCILRYLERYWVILEMFCDKISFWHIILGQTMKEIKYEVYLSYELPWNCFDSDFIFFMLQISSPFVFKLLLHRPFFRWVLVIQ